MEKIQHFSHNHPLILVNANEQHHCYICNTTCSSLQTFGCNPCGYFIHRSCADFPPINYNRHNHPLIFVENLNAEAYCSNCNRTCESNIFRCLECDFNLHLLCGPLPITIQHKRHLHPLTLMDSYFDYESEEYYCDSCEDVRDPRLCVYYCEQNCRNAYVAALHHCLMPSVIGALKGEQGDVEFRIVGRRNDSAGFIKGLIAEENEDEQCSVKVVEKKTALTFKDTLSSLTPEEREYLKSSCYSLFERDHYVAGNSVFKGWSPDMNDFTCKEFEEIWFDYYSPYGYDIFPIENELRRHLCDGNIFMKSSKLWMEDEELVNVRDMLVIKSLAPYLEDLLDKYGDISEGSTLSSSSMKTFCIVAICGVVRGMCKTKVLDVTGNLLLQWWTYLQLLKSVGFKVEFAIDRVERVVCAHFDHLRDTKSADDLANELARLDRKIKEQPIKILKLKEELLEFEESQKQHQEWLSETSSLLEECFIEAKDLKWKSAAAGLL